MMETIIATGDDTNNPVVDHQDVKLEFSAEEESVSIPSLSFGAVPRTSSKRKHTFLKKETKIEILQRLSRGESASSLAPIYGISQATVYDLKTKCHNNPEYASVIDAKTLHKFRLSQISKKRNDAVYSWFEQKRKAGDVVTGPMLCQRAIELNDHFGGPSTFKASAGWLTSFRSRWGIKELTTSPEKLTIPCSKDEFAEQKSLGRRSLSSSVEPEIIEPSSPSVKIEVLDEDESSLSPGCNQPFPSITPSMVERENTPENLQPNCEHVKLEFSAEEETLSTQSFGLMQNQSDILNSKTLSTNRNCKSLTADTKLEILNRLALGESPSNLAKIYNVSRSAISGIKFRHNRLLERETIPQSYIAQRDGALYSWYIAKRTAGEIVTRSMLCGRALELNRELGGSSTFKASYRWVTRFRSRRGIKHLQMIPEKLTNSVPIPVRETCTDSKSSGSTVLKSVPESEICNASESSIESGVNSSKIVKQCDEADLLEEQNLSSDNVIPNPPMSPSPPILSSPPISRPSSMSPSQATTTKRKRKNLTIGAKIEILNRLANGESPKSLAKIYGIQESYIHIIKKARNKILAHAFKFGSIGNAKTRKQLKKRKIVKLDDALCKWISKKQNAGETLQGSMIRKAARDLNAKMGGPSTFKASSGWLSKFQLRYGLNKYRLPIKDDTQIGSTGSSVETSGQTTPTVNQHKLTGNSLATDKSMLTSIPKITSDSRQRLTIETKVKILNRLAQGETVTSLTKVFGIGRTTLFNLRTSRNRILTLNSSSKTKNCKTFREVENTELDEAVYSWFLERRKAGKPVTAPMLCKKALELNNKMCSHPTFKATSGWLYKFRCRWGIRTFQIPTAKCYYKAKATAISLALIDFRGLINRNSLRQDDVYNAYEFSILWKPTPEILLGSDVSQSTMRSAKERVSVLLCANASGSHRLPLLVVGKTDLSEDIPEVAGLPVVYKYQPQGWLTKDIFSHWYSNVFIAKVKEFRSSEGKSAKCLLVAGNIPNSPQNAELNRIDSDFLVSSLFSPQCKQVQPMIQLLMKFNMLYQKNVLLWLLDSDKRKLICQAFEDFNIINACSLLASSWNAVLVEDMKKAWLRLWLTDDNQGTDSENEIETNDILQETLAFLRPVDGLDNCTPDTVKEWLEFNANVLSLNPVEKKTELMEENDGENMKMETNYAKNT